MEETIVPDGYLKMANQTVVIDSESKTLNLSNTIAPRGNLLIHKKGTGGVPLAGAGFTLRGNGQTYTSSLTDITGTASITNIPYGDYILEETTIPDGYAKSTNHNIKIDAATKEISLTNTAVIRGNLTIHKTGEGGFPLAGAGFTLEGNGKTYVSNLTDANGHTTITGIDYGTYTLRESTVPSGYSQVKDRIVTIDSPTKTEEMANHKPANLTESIILINEDVDNPNIKLAGGIFVITTEGYRFTVETDANGRAVLDNLPKGDYTVTQIKAANGYSVMPDNITFYLGNPQGVPAEVHAQNKKMPTSGNLPYIEIDVKNMNNQLPIAGTVIKLEGSDRSIRYLTTDANGKVLFDHLDYGVTYIGTIEDAPYMYKWPGTTPPQTPPMTVTTISPVGESTLFLAPVEISDLMIRLTEFDDIDIPIGNAKFLITDPDGGTHEVTTGADGTVTIPLYHGTYKVKQLTTDGNHLIDTQEYTIFIERQEELAIMNKLIRPELSTVDIKADKVWVDLPPSPKPDVHINLLGDGTKVRELTILANSANQTATFTALPKYDSNHYRIIYTIEEQAIPDYYAIYEMKDRRGLNWTIRNYEGKLIGDCIPGTFWVSSSTKAYEYFTNGATTGRNIPLNYTTGTAYQNSATYGYGIAQSRDGQYLYTVNRRGNLRIYNVSGTGTPVELTTTPIRLRTSAGGGLDNLNQYFHAAELSNDGTKLYVKSQEGAIIYQYNTATLLNNLGGGQVNATQQIASVTSAGDIVYLENGDLLVSGKSSNVSTGLWISRINPDGSYSSTAINVGTTNNSLNTVNTTGGVEGLGMVEGRLVMTSTTGTTPQQTALYYLDPLPTRNRPSSTVYTSTLFVNTSSTLSDYADMTSGSSSTCYGVVKVAGQKTWLNDRPENRPTSITVRLYKNGVPTDKTMVVDANTNWTYQFDDLDKYENNQRIQYTVREENTPPGYIVQYPNSTQEPNNYNITNRLEMREVHVLKKNEKGSPLSGVRFALYKEDKSTLVGSPVYTNAQGKISFTKIPLGIYYLKEISTVTGYIPDPHFYKVEIRNSIGGTPETIVYNSNGAAQNNTLLLPFEITNHPYTADLIMEKRSLLGELLPGATFTLKKDGVVIQTKTSDSDGKLGFTHLLPGTYILNETVSPNGYNPNTKDYKIVVDNQGKFKVYIQTEFGEREIVSDPLVVYNQPEQTLGYFNLSKTRYNEGTGDAPTGINGVRFELRYSDENRIDKMGDLVGTGSGSTTTGIAITANTQPQGHDTLLNGIATYSHLADGYYYLKEVYRPDPPQGSQWSTEMVEHFIKVENKIAYIWENGTWKTAGTDGAVYYTTHSFDIYNSYRTNDQILKLIIKKADGDQTTQVLQAKFQLYVGNTEGSTLPYYDINGQPVMIHTSTTGNVEYPIPMVVGTYWLKEIEAPEGYEMIPRLIGPMAVTVKEGKYVLSLQQDTHTPPLWSVTGTSQEVSTLDLTVYNRRNYPLTLEKVDEAQNRILTGEAVFQVFKKSDYDNGIFEPIATLNTVEGIASSDALFKPGEYTIVEIASPEGYQPSPTAIEVRLKIVNGLPLWEHISGPAIPKNTLEVDIAIINKTHRHPLSILKYDEKDDMIISDSAEFAVYKGEDYSYDETKDEIIIQEGAIPITVMKTVEGLATSGADFVPGKYAIVETKSPKGYRGLSEPIELELKVIGEIASWEIIHGDPGTVSIHYTGGIIVKNNLLVYPSTGGIGSIIFLMGGLAIMGASLFIDRRRKSLIVNRK